jgi:hypothetical protein
MQFYKEVARFTADITHRNSGDQIDYKAVVYEGPEPGNFYIRHSHTFKAEGALGFWYSDSNTVAESAEHAEQVVRDWAEMIENSYEYGVWVEGL